MVKQYQSKLKEIITDKSLNKIVKITEFKKTGGEGVFF